MSNNKITVFISYAKEDQEMAQKLYHDLKSEGFAPWIDCEDLLPGQNWKVITRQAILESSYFLVLLSTNSISQKGFIQKELKIQYLFQKTRVKKLSEKLLREKDPILISYGD